VPIVIVDMVVLELVEGLGRAFAVFLVEIGGGNEHAPTELADIVAAKRYVLGNIEPVNLVSSLPGNSIAT
jgi:hypothetical protein